MDLGNKAQNNPYGGSIVNAQNNQIGSQNKNPVSPIVTK